MTKQTYQVKGMHCASCAQIISKQISKIDGIASCDVNFATKQASIQFINQEQDTKKLNQYIEDLGYTLEPMHQIHNATNTVNSQHKHEDAGISKIQLRVIISMIAIVFIMMGRDIGARYNRWIMSEIIKEFFHNLMPIFATYIFFGIDTRFVKATRSYIKYGVGNMDSLIGIGSTIAFIYSFIITTFDQILGEYMDVSWNFYEGIIVVVGLSLVGRYIEHVQLAKNADAIKSLMSLQAKEAIVLYDGKEIKTPLEQVKLGDIIIVKPGESISVDGEVVYGISEVNESMITGEPLPITKQVSDLVIGGTMNVNGTIHIKANKLGADSVLAKIVDMVSNAQNLKPSIQKIADKIAGYFVPIVLILATLTLIVWIVFGKSIAPDYRIRGIIGFVAIMSIACPCALGLATPLGIINGITRATKHGILVKNTNGLLALKDITTIVFDKTGTITSGKPSIVLHGKLNTTEKEYLQIISSLEKQSHHPIARAVISRAENEGITTVEVQDFKDLPGLGVQGTVYNKTYYAGNIKFVEQKLSNFDRKIIDDITESNYTPVILFDDNQVITAYGITDTIKGGMQEIIQQLHTLGIKTVMCTGDHTNVAQQVASELGIDEVVAQATPESKAEYIKNLRKKTAQKVAMIGDGINDSVALSLADVSVSMSDGSDVSIESSDLILLKGDLKKLIDAIKISRSTNNLIYQNLFWAFSYNIIGIPLAGGWLFPWFGRQLNPVFSGLFMAVSSLFVVFNSMRGK